MARKRREPEWVGRVAVGAVHLDMLRTHGGLRGIRAENAPESALARRRQRHAYAQRADLPAPVVTLMLQLSSGEVSEPALAIWLHDHLRPRS